MRDGLTEKLRAMPQKSDFKSFAEGYDAKLVTLAGRDAGRAHAVDHDRLTLGRGPGVDLAFNDPAMSRQHAAIDFVEGRFRIRDLGSTNGLRVNGNRVQACDLQPGDHIEIGTLVFQLVIDERENVPVTYELPSDT